jgi:hypothetical protein
MSIITSLSVHRWAITMTTATLEFIIFRDLSELAVNSMGMNMGPPVVRRDEFEPRKPDGRRREMDRFNGR